MHHQVNKMYSEFLAKGIPTTKEFTTILDGLTRGENVVHKIIDLFKNEKHLQINIELFLQSKNILLNLLQDSEKEQILDFITLHFITAKTSWNSELIMELFLEITSTIDNPELKENYYVSMLYLLNNYPSKTIREKFNKVLADFKPDIHIDTYE